MNHEDRIIAEANVWHAMSASDDMDWDGFTAWLEADAEHARTYDGIALTHALIDEHRTALQAAELPQALDENAAKPEISVGIRSKWRRWAGAAIAASLVAVLIVPQLVRAPTVYETQGTPQRIALEDGSTITLAPHSRLTVTGRDAHQIALNGGAWFDIKHDPSRMLAITAGQLEIRDIGTRFDVQAEARNVRIGVAEGEVTVASEALAQPIRLDRGRSLLFDSQEGSALVRSLSAPEIGTWRSGRLFYEDTPLPLVLDDLSRYAGVRVMLPDSLRSRHFAGSLIIHDADAAIRDLAEVMDLELGRNDSGYSLRERSR